MRTKLYSIAISIACLAPFAAFADEAHKKEHGGEVFHAMKLETDIGASRDGALYSWDFDGWIGTDENKLWLKSEGEKLEGEVAEQAEYWAMYSRNVSAFWDAQIGIRFDDQPESTTYMVAGVEGLAPYFFETEAHLFISDKGDVTARLRQENDFLLTQKLITQPYLEINLSAQDVPEQEIGAGITNGGFGIQTRYEFTRKFAPYIDLSYESTFGETARMAKQSGENRDSAVASVGLRVMF